MVKLVLVLTMSMFMKQFTMLLDKNYYEKLNKVMVNIKTFKMDIMAKWSVKQGLTDLKNFSKTTMVET